MPGIAPGATPPMLGNGVCERNDRMVCRNSAREPNKPTKAMKGKYLKVGVLAPDGLTTKYLVVYVKR